MRTTRKMLAVASGLALLLPVPGHAQGVVVRAQSCASGVLVGDLGISGLDCVGDCTLTISKGGEEQNWAFSTEPLIFSIQEPGPAEGVLEAGDYLVAIDGMLITSREGGRRYANLEIGEVVVVRYRRDGKVREGRIRVGGECRRAYDSVASTGRVPPPPPRPATGVAPAAIATVVTRTAIATAPRVIVTPEPAPPAAPLAGLVTGVARVASLLDPTPRGRLGIGFSCSQCGTRTDDETGENIWFFSGPLEVTQVSPGGPADKAGLRMGDLIKAIDGHDLDTDAGGRAFGDLLPGQPAQFTVVKRNGSEVEVTVVPVEAEDRFLTGRLAPLPPPAEAIPAEPAVGVAARALPAPSPRGTVPEPTATVAPPADLPLSYSGTVAGVEVEVRGGPVAVSELKGARILLINAEGLWIRIRVPPARLRRDDPDSLSR